MEGSGYDLDGLRRIVKAAQSKREQVNLVLEGWIFIWWRDYTLNGLR